MKYIVSLLIFISISFQVKPKWKYTVHWKETHGSTGLGMETMKSHITPHATTFTNSKKAWALYWHQIAHRNYPDKLDIGGEPEIIRNVYIDSVIMK
jgi:hypothetical protein